MNLDQTQLNMLQDVLNMGSSDMHAVASEHGFLENMESCPKDLLFYAAHIALIQSEASEALEVIRAGDLNVPSKKVEGITALEDEFADIIIRTLMLSKLMGIDIGKGVSKKHAFNNTRPWKHGGKLF
jgi:NTP pyrophosphatase (non-canonical NTP hydrolase)